MLKVIIVDDEAKVCQLIYHLIDWPKKGMVVAGIALNGVDAIELVRNEQPDLMITDIQMPGYSGLELIKMAKRERPDIECIIISGFSDFDYARKAIKYGVEDYLLKPINREEFSATLDKIKHNCDIRNEQITREEKTRLQIESSMKIMRKKLIEEIQKGQERNISSLNKVNERYNYTFLPGYFQMLMIKLDYGYKRGEKNDSDVLEKAVTQIILKILEDRCIDLEIYYENSRFLVLYNYDNKNRDILNEKIQSLLDELIIQKKTFGIIKITIGMGRAVENLDDIAASCNQAMAAVEERIRVNTDRIIEGIGEYPYSTEIPYITGKMSKNLERGIELLDKQEVGHVLVTFEKELCEYQQIRGREIVNTLKEVYRNVILTLKKNAMLFVDGEKLRSVFELELDNCTTMDSMCRCLNDNITVILQKIIERKSQEAARPIRESKKYINENYMRSISLEEVSSIAGFNPTYFSSLFKKETGTTFMEYLLEIRLNKAKELLKETNLSVAAICERVGYTDLKHFQKIFKREMEVSPNQYRKLYS